MLLNSGKGTLARSWKELASLPEAHQVQNSLLTQQMTSFQHKADSELKMIDRAFGDDFFELNLSWGDFGTIISGI